MILAFNKFFNRLVNENNYIEIIDFIKSINSDKLESYKTYINKIDDNIRVFRKNMNKFKKKLSSNFKK
jgi:RIO-like serine/threonine protein kinase